MKCSVTLLLVYVKYHVDNIKLQQRHAMVTFWAHVCIPEDYNIWREWYIQVTS